MAKASTSRRARKLSEENTSQIACGCWPPFPSRTSTSFAQYDAFQVFTLESGRNKITVLSRRLRYTETFIKPESVLRNQSMEKRTISETKCESRLDSFSHTTRWPVTKLLSCKQITSSVPVDWSLVSQVKPDCAAKPKTSYRAEIKDGNYKSSSTIVLECTSAKKFLLKLLEDSFAPTSKLCSLRSKSAFIYDHFYSTRYRLVYSLTRHCLRFSRSFW